MQPAISNEREKGHLVDILTAFIHNWRYALWTVLILAAAFLVGFFGWSEWNKKLASDSTIAMEKVQDQYDSWKRETDEAKKASLETELLTALEALIARYPRHYGGQRGLFMRADVFAAGKLWDKASQDYLDLAAKFPQSYLAPISLFNGGVCLEEKGDRDGALAQYQKIGSQYGDSAVAPRAIFNTGRLQEAKGSFEEAQKSYDGLEADFPSSEWTKLAKNRIIALKVEGKLK
jgi:TolA-binding protein